MSKTAQIKSPDVPECERLSSINHTGYNRMIQEFMEHIQGLSRLLASDNLPHGWWVEVSDIDIHDLLEHLNHSGEMDWEDEIIVKWWEWLEEYCEEQNDEASEGYRIRVVELRVEDLLYKFFGIDQEKLEEERREILAACRAGNSLQEAREDLGLKD